MGIDEEAWDDDETSDDGRRLRAYVLPIVLATVLLVGVASRLPQHAASNDPEHVTHHDAAIELAGLTISLGRAPLYPKNDPWKSYLANEQTCPNAEDLTAPLHEQALTMICLINHARQGRGLTELPVSTQLSQAAQLKGAQIMRCKVFAHAPCGGDAHDVAVQAGFNGGWGENLYIADGRYGAPRPALDGWLNSPGHRENIFRPGWQLQSVYVVKLDSFPGFSSPTLWVSEFGD